ncbi:peptide chain release factor N(5)-glutamine methyltransferase [Halomonas sp. ISL-60]|uniref:peptide chain release factor N(5)-glutamine methyltransferase n=1 Tax=Halomonas sp. ISL-56 TaxID=2819149 RepID=UPI001BEB5E35|nr:peptide chain release factor N(5)-glutamine methyltransferase [Halomonas sp. ISL-56]MBT2774719.1 peptide chain release factor N(5)-glutamine methyltransferase [Halomonas sp. ISL-60]MBT2803515.1 peptide chain release factor N(5)-glutamine methyltransferase [Halomonas sp. ISL-56]
MTLDALLKQAAQRLQKAGSSSPRIDAEVLLCHVLGRDRTWLYTWGDKTCPLWEQARFDALIAARAQGAPVAYLTGEREFWGLRLATSHNTLIPRPDTETLVELALSRAALPSGRLLDLGTGTGAIALAFASEQPGWQIVGVDLRFEAVTLATSNAEALAITNAQFLQSNWFGALETFDEADKRFDIIVSNPPYIAADDPHLSEGDVRFEPRSALVADAEGMADLLHLVHSAPHYLTASGWLLLEHGYRQADKVRAALKSAGYQSVESIRDLGGHERVTLGHL